MESIVSIRIKNARVQNQLSLQQVADYLGVSKQMVSKYEKGKTLPGSEKLIALGKLFQQKVDYFFRQPEVQLGEINFRKRGKFGVKKVNAIKEELRIKIENYLLIENICHLETAFINPIAALSVQSKKDIIKAVEYLRAAWCIGNDPIYNVIALLEDHEVKVIEVNEDAMQFDGLATQIDEKYFVIVINKQMPIERKRFTLLHELGHLLLNLTGKSEKEIEKYCNWFASEMLLSEENLKIEFGKYRSSINIEELKNVQLKYGISIGAMMYKLSEEGIISAEKTLRFYKSLHTNPSFKKDMEASRFKGNESSSRYENLIYRALSEESISISKASSLLHTDMDQLRRDLSANLI